MKSKLLVNIIFLLWPWSIRRFMLVRLCGYKIDRSAKIGLSLVVVKSLEMAEGSRIGHLNIVKGLELLSFGKRSNIGNGNWISGLLTEDRRFFRDFPDRRSELLIGDEAGVSHLHRIDCSDRITIGEFATVGGYFDQLLTHAQDLELGRQSCSPVVIGAYSFIGTRTLLLPGSKLPPRSVLGAGSVLLQAYEEELFLYSGFPAKPIRALSPEMKYFTRTTGHVE